MKQAAIIIAIASLSLIGYESQAQFLLSAGMDLYKTDNQGFGRKNQIGIEGNYFLTGSFTILGGVEFWSDGPTNQIAIGGRWYIVNPVYIKFRGLLSNSAEVSLGMGHSQPLDRNWRLDLGGDYYYNSKEFAFRLGLGYKFH
jgi:hypothetical protein